MRYGILADCGQVAAGLIQKSLKEFPSIDGT
jgi:hypothetical protein